MVEKAFIRCSRQAYLRQQARPVPVISSKQACIYRAQNRRTFSTTGRQQESFGTRLRRALGNTKIKWYPIPAALGIAFLGLGQAYRVNEREKAKLALEESDDGMVNFQGTGADELDSQGRPKKRKRIRPTGPWYDWPSQLLSNINNKNRQVQVMSTLPLKAVSRVWGKFNELEIPYYLRVPGFKLYSFIFGVKSVAFYFNTAICTDVV